MTRPLDRAAREEAWQRLENGSFGVLVIGGGVTGCGVALDAITRGLSVALVEARDLASGTSSRSSKLFHGGLRYLEQRDFRLVREALHERELMLTRLAPHLVHPVTFLYPLQHRVWERPYVAAGLTMYDTLGGKKSLPRHRYLSRNKASAAVPGMRSDAFVGAMQYGDGQTDDARHTMMVARTAVEHGALVRTSTQVTRLLREPPPSGGDKVVGAELRDTETGATCHVRARVVINCTGVWTDDIQEMVSEAVPFRVRASKGIHITVPRERIPSETGLILRTEKSVLFVIPWKNLWLIGTTDTDWHLDLAHPAASASDIDYVLDHINSVLVTPLTHDDIVSVYSGLRPLLAGESDQTSKLSREHAVSRVMPGLVSIAGGKYTTYRVMAKDALDAAHADLPADAGPCVTDHRPIIGAADYDTLLAQAEVSARRYGIEADRMRGLLGRYGSLVSEVLDPMAMDQRLAEPVHGAPGYLNAEIVYAVTHEGALHLDDILARRTRIAMETRHRGTESAGDVARLVAPLLGWDAVRVASEVSAYVARVEFERASQAQPDDAEAEAVRLLAPDTRHPVAFRNTHA